MILYDMKTKFTILLLFAVAGIAAAQEFNQIPKSWKWLSDTEVVFSYDASYTDTSAFSVDASSGARRNGVKAPEKFVDFPIKPVGAINLTYSPDSTMLAFTRDNDLYVVNIADSVETRLTFDGSDVILNGYASWVYYEEIFGRPSKYRAFWWSPDSRKLAFYRFDNSNVPMFPICRSEGRCIPVTKSSCYRSGTWRITQRDQVSEGRTGESEGQYRSGGREIPTS